MRGTPDRTETRTAGTVKTAAIGICSALLLGTAVWFGWTATHPTHHPLVASGQSTTSPVGSATPAPASTGPTSGRKVGGVPVEPSGHATDTYINQTFTAPASDVSSPGVGGRLVISSIDVNAPIDVVHLDGEAMAIPNLTSQVGWLDGTAAFGDVTGASVIAGHVADDSDIPGALWQLKNIHIGATITWINPSGHKANFKVSSMASYPRTIGVPASVFRTDGPHTLNLITCFDKITFPDGGFHYTRNLVVTARQVTS